MQAEYVQKVIDVIARTQKLAPEQVTIDSEFAALQIDSIDAVELLFELENEFGIVISDEQMHSVRTVRQVAEAVEGILTAKTSGAGA